jgi:hypothetical protein
VTKSGKENKMSPKREKIKKMKQGRGKNRGK